VQSWCRVNGIKEEGQKIILGRIIQNDGNIVNFFDNEDLEDQEFFAGEISENPLMETEQVEYSLGDFAWTKTNKGTNSTGPERYQGL